MVVDPRPLVCVVVAVQTLKLSVHSFQLVQFAALNFRNHIVNFAFRSNKTGNINPFTIANLRVGNKTCTNFIVAVEVDGFKSLYNRVAHKFVNGSGVERDAVEE